MSPEVKALVVWALSPMILAILLQGLALLLWLQGRRRTRRSGGGEPFSRAVRLAPVLAVFGFLLLAFGSLPALTYEANRAREYVHEPLDPASLPDDGAPLAVAVLGTGFNPDPWLPANSQVSGTAHARFLEGVRIHRARPGSRLLVSVANDRATFEEKADFLAAMASLVGLDPASVELVHEALDTDDEARLVRERLEGGARVVLATSAGHMPRAMALFAAIGLEAHPAPCDFHHPRAGSPNERVWQRWLPSEGGSAATRAFLYETIAKVKGALAGKAEP